MNVRDLVSALMQYDMDAEVKAVKFGSEDTDDSEIAMPIQELGDDGGDEVYLYYVAGDSMDESAVDSMP